MEPLNFKIKTEKDLEQVLDYLKNQGFYIHNSWDLHKHKVDKIYNDANTLGIDYPSSIKDYYKEKNYEELEKKAKEYFSKFGVDDKINEYLNKFHLHQDEQIHSPSFYHTDKKDIINWVKFKKKYGVKDGDFGTGRYIHVYNFDKPYLKINFGYNYGWEFKRFYRLLFNEEYEEFSDKNYGDWQNLGKLEIKIFKNGSANIKGELERIKEYYYKYEILKKYNDMIVIYKKKKELIHSKNN